MIVMMKISLESAYDDFVIKMNILMIIASAWVGIELYSIFVIYWSGRACNMCL